MILIDWRVRNEDDEPVSDPKRLVRNAETIPPGGKPSVIMEYEGLLIGGNDRRFLVPTFYFRQEEHPGIPSPETWFLGENDGLVDRYRI